MIATGLTMEYDTPQAVARPHINAHFVVDLGLGSATDADAGFCEVVFPEFRIDPAERVDRGDAPQVASAPPRESSSRRLILRRGVTGSRDLYEWWNEARRGAARQPRTVTVHLMTPNLSTAVLTWRFHGARPVCLSYAPLNALQPTVLIESVELEFDMMEMC
jgi:phage tail-like protein